MKKITTLTVSGFAVAFLTIYGAQAKWEQVDQQFDQDNQYITVSAFDDVTAIGGGMLSNGQSTSAYASYTTSGTKFSATQFGSSGGGMMPIPSVPFKMVLPSKKTGYAIDIFTGKVFKTTSGGSGWQEEQIPVKGGGIMGDGPSFRDLDAIDGAHAWAVGTKSLVLRLGYGPAGWEEVTSFKQSAGELELTTVKFANLARGYILARDEKEDKTQVFYTRNGGSAWEKLGELPYKVYGISFGTCEIIFAAAEKNKTACILKSTDGGASWSENCNLPMYPLKNPLNGKVEDYPNVWVSAIQMYDENLGVALAQHNQCQECDPDELDFDEKCPPCGQKESYTSLLRTTNGGETWYRDTTFDPEKISSESGGDGGGMPGGGGFPGGGGLFAPKGFFSFSCPTKNTCYLAGVYCTMMRWTNDNPVEDDGAWKTKTCTAPPPETDGGISIDGGSGGGGSKDDDDSDASNGGGGGSTDDDNDAPGGSEDDDDYDGIGGGGGRGTIDQTEKKEEGCGCRIR